MPREILINFGLSCLLAAVTVFIVAYALLIQLPEVP